MEQPPPSAQDPKPKPIRGPKRQTLAAIATQCGYPDEKALLTRLYLTDRHSLPKLEKILGYSRSFIRRRLIACGIDRRTPGMGPKTLTITPRKETP